MLHFTCDIDWAPDEVIADTLDLFARAGVPCTLFGTHQSAVLAGIAEDLFEVALHPNFNPLLQGAGGSAADTLARLRDIFPDAVGVRSHSLTSSTPLSALFAEQGLRYESNTFMPYADAVRPYRLWNGLLRIPFNWEDDVHFMYGRSFDEPGIDPGHAGCQVYVFHPVHLFLNTECAGRYERARPHYHDPAALRDLRNTTGVAGSRDLLIRLLEHTARTGRAALLRDVEVTAEDRS
jgi:hypothetical protein